MERIRRRAREIWEAEGRPEGCEREIPGSAPAVDRIQEYKSIDFID